MLFRSITRDPRFGNIDMLTSAILEFPSGHAIFTCSTQIMLNQSMCFYGATGRIQPDIPFNPTSNAVSRIRIDDGRDVEGSGAVVEEFPPCDQYKIQGDLFARAIREGGPPPVPLEDAVRTMAVIDAIFRSANTNQWERPEI